MPRVKPSASDTGPTARAACVIALTIAVALIHILFFRPFFTALIFDEVAHLVSAKYLFEDINLDFYGWTMKGHSLLLYLLALPFGGLGRFSSTDVYNLSWIANVAMSAAFVPLMYAFLRDFRIGFSAALLGAATIASLPLFYIFSPLAMTELFFAALCMFYLFAFMRFFDRPLVSGLPWLLATLGLTAAITATKAAGTYDFAAVCAFALLLYRINVRTVVFVALSVIVIYLVRQTRMMFGYDVELSAAKVLPHLGVLVIGLTASLAISLIYFAPLAGMAALSDLGARGTALFRASWRQPVDDQQSAPDSRAFNALVIATFGFLMPAIAVSSLFHAMIDRFTNYRTVASVIPVFVAATLAFFLAPRQQDDRTASARSLRCEAGLRASIIVALFATIFAMKALSQYFFVDNFFDFVTVLPVYDYMTQPFWSRAALWLLGLAAAFTCVSLLPSRGLRMAGLIVINIALLGSYLTSSWSTDKGTAVFHSANLRMYEEVVKRDPKFVVLIDFPPDVQWLHFGYPYAWRDAAHMKMPILGPGNEAVTGRGTGVVRFPALNADFRHKEPAGRQTFLSYDLDKPQTRELPRTPIAALIAQGNTVNFNPPESAGSASFASAQVNAMLGPFILPAGETTRVILWATPAAAEAQYRGCALIANKSRWPLEPAAPPSAPASELVLAADVTVDETLFGMLRLDCPLAATQPNGKSITLPLLGMSVIQSK
jgi:hypothetical protein